MGNIWRNLSGGNVRIPPQHVADCRLYSLQSRKRERSNNIPLRYATARNDDEILSPSSRRTWHRQIAVTVQLFRAVILLIYLSRAAGALRCYRYRHCKSANNYMTQQNDIINKNIAIAIRSWPWLRRHDTCVANAAGDDCWQLFIAILIYQICLFVRLSVITFRYSMKTA